MEQFKNREHHLAPLWGSNIWLQRHTSNYVVNAYPFPKRLYAKSYIQSCRVIGYVFGHAKVRLMYLICFSSAWI